MNAAALTTAGKVDTVHYAGPINPPAILRQKLLSKILRTAGLKGDFFFFSDRRLQWIAGEVRARCHPDAKLDFFHGFTPWIFTKPPRPYMAWSDCTFRDYTLIYHRRERFRSADLERIETAEAAWLRNARVVGFTSDWAAKRAERDYKLEPERIVVLGIFGEIEMPPRDLYAGGKQFAFVSTNFEAKGGPAVLAAFREVRKRYPEASLIIVGDRPRDAAIEPGVVFTGFLHKEVEAEKARFREILGQARAIVHPTKSDIAPLLILEAAYFGCPVISARSFAIPELVDDTRTGVLLDDPTQPSAVADAMIWMLENEDEYRQMRRAAWMKSRERHSKQRFEERLMSSLRRVLGKEGGA